MKTIKYISAKRGDWQLGRFENIHAMALVIGVQYGLRFQQKGGLYYLDSQIIEIEYCERRVKEVA